MVALGPRDNATAVAHVVTTTIFAGPTAAPVAAASQSSGTQIPIGAIVGGSVGGVAIALFVVTAWAWWGRCLRRQQERQRKEMRDLLTVRENTRRNAGPVPRESGPYTTPPPRSARHGGRRIKFAAMPGDIEKPSSPSPPGSPHRPLTPLEQATVLPPPLDLAEPLTPTRTFLSRSPRFPWGSSVLPASGPVVMPRAKLPRPDSAMINGIDVDPEKLPFEPGVEEDPRQSRASAHLDAHLRHMPSAISTESVYSTQSGEARVPALPRQRSGLFATLRQQLDINRLSTLTRSTASWYSIDDQAPPMPTLPSHR